MARAAEVSAMGIIWRESWQQKEKTFCLNELIFNSELSIRNKRCGIVTQHSDNHSELPIVPYSVQRSIPSVKRELSPQRFDISCCCAPNSHVYHSQI